SGPRVPKHQCVVDGVSGVPDSCEYAGLGETPDFSSSSTALTLGQAAPLLTVPEKPTPTKSDAQVQAQPQWHGKLCTWHLCLKRKVLVCKQGMQHRKLNLRQTSQFLILCCKRTQLRGRLPSLDTSAASSPEPSPPRRFIVYEDCLLQPTNLCRKCHHPAQSSLKVIGSLVVVTTCPNMPSTKWYSQPTQRRIGHDNVLLAAAILFTRCSPTEPLRLVENAGICSFSKCTYDRIQKDILFPAEYKVCMIKGGAWS
ncbi:hypothetical protein V5799_031108, partial [Amblyomma americanum]